MISNSHLCSSSNFSSLLDFNAKLDIGLLDEVVKTLYSGVGSQQKLAQDVLTSLKDHPDAWTKVDTILEFSSNPQTKYYALQILESVIKSKWKILPRNQCEGIKKYIVGLIIKTSSDPTSLEKEKTYLNKLNMILVQILKREWPKNWNSFIPDIIGASKTNESLCQNNMVILKLLSEEVFDFSSGQITQTKAKHLKDTMCSQFSDVFTLCIFVLENSPNAPLVGATLETLLRFLNWIPLGYIFETKLISTLIFKFLSVPLFRNLTLKALTEIASVVVPHYEDVFIKLFSQTMSTLETLLPLETDIKEAYGSGSSSEQQFIQDLSLFLVTFLKEHGVLIERDSSGDVLLKALHYLLLISQVEDVEIFKIVLEYWNSLSADLYRESPFSCGNSPLFMTRSSSSSNALSVSGASSSAPPPPLRRQFFTSVLSKVRYIMISRMAKPEEVLVVENDQGEVVREFMRDTDSITLYKNMRETLVYLTHLDYTDTESIMTEKLGRQVNGSEWSWKNLNTLCWAIGSISGSMQEEDEKRFLVTVIKDLLGLCEQKKGKDNKAIIASNIMYIVGQYPRFLRAHWRFLKTVVNKLFEFMHETHEGVQDMACDTFIKISQKCRKQFITLQPGETFFFIEELLSSITSIICDLQPQQVHTFYEAVGHMISACTDPHQQEQLIDKYMMLPNAVWDDIISQASSNVEVLKEPEVVKQLGSILKTNVRACKALGHSYVLQLGKIYLDMLNVYKVMSENIMTATRINGEAVIRQSIIKSMRVVKKETLRLFSTWVDRSNDPLVLLDNFLPHLLDSVLLDYPSCSLPSAREPEVLSTLTITVNKLKGSLLSTVPLILSGVFDVTLKMINKNFEDFPEHRTNFYLLLQSLVSHTFEAFVSIPVAQFKIVLDAIIWAFKHTMRNVADTGLSILYTLLKNVEGTSGPFASFFYSAYYTELLQHMFSVLTDSSHSAGLTMHATILSYMFSLLESSSSGSLPLLSASSSNLGSSEPRMSGSTGLPPPPSTNNSIQNRLYIQNYVGSLLSGAYPHLTEQQIKVTVSGLFSLNEDMGAFKEHLRDFLVQVREHSGVDDSDLFLEERERSLMAAAEEKRKAQMEVPGILNPHELPEEMQEM